MPLDCQDVFVELSYWARKRKGGGGGQLLHEVEEESKDSLLYL